MCSVGRCMLPVAHDALSFCRTISASAHSLPTCRCSRPAYTAFAQARSWQQQPLTVRTFRCPPITELSRPAVLGRPRPPTTAPDAAVVRNNAQMLLS